MVFNSHEIKLAMVFLKMLDNGLIEGREINLFVGMAVVHQLKKWQK